MTRRDFELIARVLHNAVDTVTTNDGYAEVKALARDFATNLKAAYPRFNQERFLKAAGFPKDAD